MGSSGSFRVTAIVEVDVQIDDEGEFEEYAIVDSRENEVALLDALEEKLEGLKEMADSLKYAPYD